MAERSEPVLASPISVSEGLAEVSGASAPVQMVEFVFHTRAAGLDQPMKEISLVMTAEDVGVMLKLAFEAAMGLGLIQLPAPPSPN